MRLFIFDTHPIQYRSPVFRFLQRPGLDARVFFFDHDFDPNPWWFQERGTARSHNWGTDLTGGFDHEFLDLRSKSLWGRFRELSLLIEKERPDAILIYGHYLAEHWMLRLLCGQLGIPLLFVGETFEAQARSWRRVLRSFLLRWFFSGVSRFISIGEKNYDYYRAHEISADKIERAKYCIDNHFFVATPEEAESMRTRWRSRHQLGDSLVALFVGRLFSRKRPTDLIEAIDKIRDRPVVGVFAGNGEMLTGLEELSKSRTNIRILGFQDQHQLREAYHGADLLVVCSEFETWGLVVNEAFACGLPAIVTDRCGCAEDLVISGQTGAVVPVGNPSVLAQAIETLGHSQNRSILAKNARERVIREFTPESFANAIAIASFSVEGLNAVGDHQEESLSAGLRR